MKCSYCGGNTRWTEEFCNGGLSMTTTNTWCGAPLHRPDCKRERGCNCSERPFQDGEIDRDGKVYDSKKGWIKPIYTFENKEVYFCGLHRFKTRDHYTFILHIINEHDTEHGVFQRVGTHFTQTDLRTGIKTPYYGLHRTLPIFCPFGCNCRCNTGSGCWRDPKSCQEPEVHKLKTKEEYFAWVDRKWHRDI